MKYALVTGATTGMGLAIAKELISKGYFVYMHYIEELSIVDTVTLAPDIYKLIETDFSYPESADILVRQIIEDGVKLDCVVLNAGTTCRKDFGEINYDDWNAVMNVNVNSPFLICQSLAPVIKDFGSIIFIGSSMGIHPHASVSVYSVSKAATHMLAKSLVKHFADRKIRVNAVAPGFIDTQWQKDKPQWHIEKIESKIALGRFGTPEEIVDACMFLLNNTYMNGSVLQIDGGYDFE
ncbi:MAG: SDR family oxidoreductase [Oscillospiraceae bacterium]|nr:SDR family oxidoreductase [Oscillospiraceae bacterium]